VVRRRLAALVLAVGIGATSITFSLIDATLRCRSRDRGVLPPPHGHLANALAVRECDRLRRPARRRSPNAPST